MTKARAIGWSSGAALAALALSGLVSACSSDPAATVAEDSGAPVTIDSSIADAGPGFTLDAQPTPLADAAAGDDASDDAEPDVIGPCAKASASDPCGLDPQCGCPSSDTCDIASDKGDTVCAVAGTGLAGHACVTTASCRPGLTCVFGACRPYCTTSGDAGCAALAGGGSCIALDGADGGPVPNFRVCTFRCGLQDRNACGATGSLYAGCLEDGLGGTDCALVGNVDLGGDCTVQNCKPGLVCLGDNTSANCFAWCRLGHSPSDCDDAGTCTALAGADGGPSPVIANGIGYGYCP